MATFTSAKDRTTEAHKQFQAILDQYPHTRTAEFAHYFLGLTSYQLGDNAAAERDLKNVASTRNEDLAALAKLALAAVYGDTNRTKDAIDLYNQLIAKPTRSVGKTTAQMELAEMYVSTQQPARSQTHLRANAKRKSRQRSGTVRHPETADAEIAARTSDLRLQTSASKSFSILFW